MTDAFFRPLIAGGLAGAACAAAAHAQESRSYALDEFDSIDAQGRFDVSVAVGEDWSVSADGSAGDLEDIEVERDGAWLRIKQPTRWFGGTPDLDVRVTVSMPAMVAAEVSRGAAMEISGVDSETFSLEVAMGAYASVEGGCGELNVEAAMGAEADASNLRCRSVQAEAAMGAEARVHATESATAEAAMGAEVVVYGDPASFSGEGAMGGDVTRVRGDDS